MKICFVALNSYGVISGRPDAHFGGAESQVQLMGSWFSKRGHDVSVVVWDDGGPSNENFDGVRVIKFARRSDGIRILRYIRPRWTNLNIALRAVDADVYVQNCAEHTTGQIALWCKRRGKPFVYLVASDADCKASHEHRGAFFNRWLFRYGLRNNSQLIAQTNTQREMLLENHSRIAITVPMAGTPRDVAIPDKRNDPTNQRQVLWVGRLCRIKRVEMILEVAKKMPDVTFNIVGKADDSARYVAPILKEMESTKNVVYHGGVTRQEMSLLYSRTRLLCCTSSLEGFPNVFLESWSYGNPVISTFDPDGVIADRQLGTAVRDSAEMARSIARLLDDPVHWRELSKNATRYFETFHTPDVVFLKYEKIFKRVSTGE